MYTYIYISIQQRCGRIEHLDISRTKAIKESTPRQQNVVNEATKSTSTSAKKDERGPKQARRNKTELKLN